MSVVLITGCSSGFGELIARTLATHGHRAYASMRGVSGRNAEAARRLTEWAASAHVPLSVVELDVTSDTSVREAVEHIQSTDGDVDVVVNNAASSSRGPLEAFSIAQMAALLDVNVLGGMRVNKAVLPAMRARGAGLIIWVSSTLGRVLVGGGLYPASKWAVEGFAESLHHQVAPFGIEVVILEPGSFPTPSTSNAMRAEDQAITDAYAAVPTPARNRQLPTDGSYQPPDPQEVADAVLEIVQIPAGQRPLRRVVGPQHTDGVPAYNQAYEQLRQHMAEVLRRPDQAVTWGPASDRR
ncbi:MAG: SDR family oxidoreductase [Chloroflexi bacterium]|nr:SDR family oxidoreductase [Chloroflexota bacterium]